jgi:hypothetical protein
LPGVLVDNYTIVSAPSFFDYDSLVIDPRAAGQLVERIVDDDASTAARTFAGGSVRVRPSGPDEVELAAVLRRRRDETSRLLDNGGAVVVFTYPDRTHRIGEDGWAEYDWLPLPDELKLGPPLLMPGEGAQALVVDWQHPMAAFVSCQSSNVAYRAHIDGRRLKGGRVFAQSKGGAAIGVELPLESGRLFLLPALKAAPVGDARYAASEALQTGIRRALGAQAPGRTPPWVVDLPFPGLAEASAALATATQASEEAQRAEEAAKAALDALGRFQALLWQEGPGGLDEVVLEALRRIGFDVFDRQRDEVEIRLNDMSVLVEIEGSERPIDMAPHHRLRQRIERAIERRDVAPRGVLFVNGERLRPLRERTQATDALLLAAETMRYCLAPTSGLYAALVAQLEGDADTVAAYRQQLMETNGLLS